MKHDYGKLLLICLLISHVVWPPARACTAFLCVEGEREIAGRNLDWPISHGHLIISPRGVRRTGLIRESGTPATWQARYGSSTLCQFGSGLPLEGMNETGLVVIELSLSISVYPHQPELPVVNEFQAVQYLLDTCASCEEAVHAIQTIRISPVLAHLHYFLSDRNGNAAVIQFLDGRCMIFKDEMLPIPVLTNNRYTNLLKYLHHHRGFGGKRLVSAGPESPERFVRAASLLQSGHKLNKGLVEQAAQIQDAVMQSDTVWRVLYEPDTGCIRFSSNREGKTTWKLITPATWYEEGSPVRYADVLTDMAGDFLQPSIWNTTVHAQLLDRVIHQWKELGELDRADRIMELLRKSR